MAREDKEKYMNNQCQDTKDNSREGKTRDLFKKIGEIKRKFYANIGTITDKYARDLMEKKTLRKDDATILES